MKQRVRRNVNQDWIMTVKKKTVGGKKVPLTRASTKSFKIGLKRSCRSATGEKGPSANELINEQTETKGCKEGRTKGVR